MSEKKRYTGYYLNNVNGELESVIDKENHCHHIHYKDVVDLLNEQDAKIKELEKELHIKEDLIQQLKNELNTDCYKQSEKYRKEFIRVCEDLAEANKTIKELKNTK
jgi:peptidoglycan hydrolase CwlO-like protein